MSSAYGNEWTSSPFTIDLAGDISNTLWRREFSVSLTQNIYSGGAIFEEVNRNIALFQAQNYKTWSVINEIALNVSEAYMDVLLRKKLVDIAQTNFDEHERLVNLIRQRGEAGVARYAELDQGESRLALADSNLINAKGNERESHVRFRKFVGDWPTNLVNPVLPTEDSFPQDLDDAVKEGFHNHPTVRSANEGIKQAISQRKISKAAFYPKFDAVFTISRNRNLDGVPGGNNENVSLIRMNYNLFKGGSDLGRLRKTAFQVQEAFETRDRSMIDLREKIQLDYNSWYASKKRAVVLYDYIVSIEKTRKSYFEQFKIGQRTFLDLLNSQNEVFRSKNDYLQASRDEINARYRILNSVGRLVTFFAKQQGDDYHRTEVFTLPVTTKTGKETFDIKEKEQEKPKIDEQMVYPTGKTTIPKITVNMQDDNSDTFTSSKFNDDKSVIPVIDSLNFEPLDVQGNTLFVAELSGFKSVKAAKKMSTLLLKKGYIAVATVDDVAGLNMAHVLVGPYKNAIDADEALEIIIAEKHVFGVVRKVLPEDNLAVGKVK
jgi:outer membrane protein, adhesin transport system